MLLSSYLAFLHANDLSDAQVRQMGEEALVRYPGALQARMEMAEAGAYTKGWIEAFPPKPKEDAPALLEEEVHFELLLASFDPADYTALLAMRLRDALIYLTLRGVELGRR
jgi:hypothetical protein